jgi:hypothetical protein
MEQRSRQDLDIVHLTNIDQDPGHGYGMRDIGCSHDILSCLSLVTLECELQRPGVQGI